jgi:hypothetical protein
LGRRPGGFLVPPFRGTGPRPYRGEVIEHPGFGVLLDRLLTRRGTDLARLAASSGIAEAGLHTLIDGTAPSDAQLRTLAPALGFHAADLFVIANVPVPEDLTPLDPTAGRIAAHLMDTMWALPPDQRRRVHRLVAELPQEPRPDVEPGAARARTFDQCRNGLAAMPVTMLWANRNLGPRIAHVVTRLTRGRMYLSIATYPGMANHRAPLRPEWVAGFATALGIPVGDLAALIGVPLPDEPLRDDPLAAELAGLLWNVRRLTASQTTLVRAEVDAMLVPVPEGAPDHEWNRVFHAGDGTWWGAPRTPGE